VTVQRGALQRMEKKMRHGILAAIVFLAAAPFLGASCGSSSPPDDDERGSTGASGPSEQACLSACAAELEAANERAAEGKEACDADCYHDCALQNCSSCWEDCTALPPENHEECDSDPWCCDRVYGEPECVGPCVENCSAIQTNAITAADNEHDSCVCGCNDSC
jgi:hypothetical protein